MYKSQKTALVPEWNGATHFTSTMMELGLEGRSAPSPQSQFQQPSPASSPPSPNAPFPVLLPADDAGPTSMGVHHRLGSVYDGEQ